MLQASKQGNVQGTDRAIATAMSMSSSLDGHLRQVDVVAVREGGRGGPRSTDCLHVECAAQPRAKNKRARHTKYAFG
jgi:hypothetical protein